MPANRPQFVSSFRSKAAARGRGGGGVAFLLGRRGSFSRLHSHAVRYTVTVTASESRLHSHAARFANRLTASTGVRLAGQADAEVRGSNGPGPEEPGHMPEKCQPGHAPRAEEGGGVGGFCPVPDRPGRLSLGLGSLGLANRARRFPRWTEGSRVGDRRMERSRDLVSSPQDARGRSFMFNSAATDAQAPLALAGTAPSGFMPRRQSRGPPRGGGAAWPRRGARRLASHRAARSDAAGGGRRDWHCRPRIGLTAACGSEGITRTRHHQWTIMCHA